MKLLAPSNVNDAALLLDQTAQEQKEMLDDIICVVDVLFTATPLHVAVERV